MVGIKHILATPFHPQTNGKLEGYHQTLKRDVNQLPYELPSDEHTDREHLHPDRIACEHRYPLDSAGAWCEAGFGNWNLAQTKVRNTDRIREALQPTIWKPECRRPLLRPIRLPTSSEVLGVDWITGILGQEVTRGMREAAIRGFWVSTYAPFGYKKVSVQDGAKKRPKLELDSPADAVVRRIFQMALQGKSTLDITKTLNGEGIPTSTGKHWLKSTVHRILSNEAYTGTLVWGVVSMPRTVRHRCGWKTPFPPSSLSRSFDGSPAPFAPRVLPGSTPGGHPAPIFSAAW